MPNHRGENKVAQMNFIRGQAMGGMASDKDDRTYYRVLTKKNNENIPMAYFAQNIYNPSIFVFN